MVEEVAECESPLELALLWLELEFAPVLLLVELPPASFELDAVLFAPSVEEAELEAEELTDELAEVAPLFDELVRESLT